MLKTSKSASPGPGKTFIRLSHVVHMHTLTLNKTGQAKPTPEPLINLLNNTINIIQTTSHFELPPFAYTLIYTPPPPNNYTHNTTLSPPHPKHL
jgi:hypothetical protein